MSNTRDTIGEQAALDGLVNHSLTTFEENGLTSLGNYALYRQEQLKSVKFPNLTKTGDYAFQYCTGLEHITEDMFPALATINQSAFANDTELIDAAFPAVSSVGSSAFSNCSNLEKADFTGRAKPTIGASAFSSCAKLAGLILRSSEMAALSNLNALDETLIRKGNGAVYVPESLLSTYKANSNWRNFAILPISGYPANSFETTGETWAQIKANGGENLVLGDRKKAKINGIDYMAVLVAKEKDVLASGSGNAAMTWMLFNILETHRMNATATTEGGYETSEIRSHIVEDILPTFELKDMVEEVSKTSALSDGTQQTTAEKLWIPSRREVAGNSETSGCTYTDFFTNDSLRIKYSASGSAGSWWLRSASSASGFWYVYSYGGANSYNASNAYGVVLGFCL